MPSSEVMGKFKAGTLHSGSKGGPKVGNRKQAIAIMLSEQRAEKANGGSYPEKRVRGGDGHKLGGKMHPQDSRRGIGHNYDTDMKGGGSGYDGSSEDYGGGGGY